MSVHTSEDLNKNYHKIFKGRNFMTPRVVYYGTINGIDYELSSGKGLDDKGLYGVTLHKDGEILHELNSCFGSYCEAVSYIEEITGFTENQD